MEEVNYDVSQVNNEGYWNKIGIARKNHKQFWVKLQALPLPDKNGNVFINLFERKQNNEVPEKYVQET